MSRSYWLPAIALGLVLAGAANANPIRHQTSHSEQAPGAQPKPKPDAPPSIPVSVQNAIQRIASALESANNKQPTKAEKKQAYKNLRSQQHMAKWAKWMFFTGVAETLLTLLGVFLVWKTLEASWAAAREAKRAADAAQDALNALDRPHFAVCDISIAPIEDGPETAKDKIAVGFHLQNYGEDLGFMKKYGIARAVGPAGTLLPDNLSLTLSDTHWPIVPQQAWGWKIDDCTVPIELNEEARRSIISGAKTLYVYGAVTYADSAGKEHETRFIYNLRLKDRFFVPFNDARYWKYT